MKRALVTGVTGQDGHYLAQYLTGRGYTVHGMIRRISAAPDLPSDVTPVVGDLTDYASLVAALTTAKPDVVFNLAAFSAAATAWSHPDVVADVTATGVARLLAALRQVNPDARFVQASSGQQFGRRGFANVRAVTELTPFYPCDPYAIAKTTAHHTVVAYREAFGTHASNAIMFNHFSPRRSGLFVDRKITMAAARIARGVDTRPLVLYGDGQTLRDWGWAADFMPCLVAIAESDRPDDHIVATGASHSVEEFATVAFATVGLDWKEWVVFEDPDRPSDIPRMDADPSRTRQRFSWRHALPFETAVSALVRHDMDVTCTR